MFISNFIIKSSYFSACLKDVLCSKYVLNLRKTISWNDHCILSLRLNITWTLSTRIHNTFYLFVFLPYLSLTSSACLLSNQCVFLILSTVHRPPSYSLAPYFPVFSIVYCVPCSLFIFYLVVSPWHYDDTQWCAAAFEQWRTPFHPLFVSSSLVFISSYCLPSSLTSNRHFQSCYSLFDFNSFFSWFCQHLSALISLCLFFFSYIIFLSRL